LEEPETTPSSDALVSNPGHHPRDRLQPVGSYVDVGALSDDTRRA
jgi:hypothetical protein